MENTEEFRQFKEEASAIEEALDDVAKGDRGIPFEEFDRDFCNRHNIPA